MYFYVSIIFLIVPIQTLNYTNASSEVNRSAVLSAYSSLSTISNYLVEIEDTYEIYPNLE